MGIAGCARGELDNVARSTISVSLQEWDNMDGAHAFRDGRMLLLSRSR
jgi:hypothetical protein